MELQWQIDRQTLMYTHCKSDSTIHICTLSNPADIFDAGKPIHMSEDLVSMHTVYSHYHRLYLFEHLLWYGAFALHDKLSKMLPSVKTIVQWLVFYSFTLWHGPFLQSLPWVKMSVGMWPATDENGPDLCYHMPLEIISDLYSESFSIRHQEQASRMWQASNCLPFFYINSALWCGTFPWPRISWLVSDLGVHSV